VGLFVGRELKGGELRRDEIRGAEVKTTSQETRDFVLIVSLL